MEPSSYLSELEINKIKAFNEDNVLKEAIRKVMLEPLYNHGVMRPEGTNDPTINFVLTPVFNMLMGKREMWSDEQVGQFTKASAMAIQLIEQGFGGLDKFKNEPEIDRTPTDNVAV